MSHTYHLICVETLECLDLGKIVSIGNEGMSIPWQMSGWRDLVKGEWITNDRLWKAVERFLILNRGKTLCVVPDAFLHEVDPDGDLFTRVNTFGDIMQRSVNPEPDNDDDLKRLELDLKNRIALMRSKQCSKNAIGQSRSQFTQ